MEPENNYPQFRDNLTVYLSNELEVKRNSFQQILSYLGPIISKGIAYAKHKHGKLRRMLETNEIEEGDIYNSVVVKLERIISNLNPDEKPDNYVFQVSYNAAVDIIRESYPAGLKNPVSIKQMNIFSRHGALGISDDINFENDHHIQRQRGRLFLVLANLLMYRQRLSLERLNHPEIGRSLPLQIHTFSIDACFGVSEEARSKSEEPYRIATKDEITDMVDRSLHNLSPGDELILRLRYELPAPKDFGFDLRYTGFSVPTLSSLFEKTRQHPDRLTLKEIGSALGYSSTSSTQANLEKAIMNFKLKLGYQDNGSKSFTTMKPRFSDPAKSIVRSAFYLAGYNRKEIASMFGIDPCDLNKVIK